MKIKSNKTFECYETAYENWHGGKDITLDGIKLIPITILDKIKTEIKEWYWQADKQALSKDPCVVDAMIDLFIRTIDQYKAETKIEQGFKF